LRYIFAALAKTIYMNNKEGSTLNAMLHGIQSTAFFVHFSLHERLIFHIFEFLVIMPDPYCMT